jgi:hypothetical protein
MILIITVLASLSILFFATNDVEASLSDLDNIKTSRSINPENNSRTQDEAGSDKGNIRDSIKPQDQSQTQDEAESDGIYTKAYPTEEEYCRIQILDEKPTREGYSLKFGTNNADELFGTPNNDLIFGLDGNDHIYGLEGGDIICGGKGDDVSIGDPPSSSSDEIPKSTNGDLPKSWDQDLIFGQEGNDSIYGGAGSDIIQGGIGDDDLFGHNGVWTGGKPIHNDGNDLIDGGPGHDSCHDHQSKTYLNCEYTDNAIVK